MTVQAESGRRLQVSMLLALLLSACVVTAPPQTSPAPRDLHADPPPRGDDAVESFGWRQRASAETAMQERRWADALWAWDVVLALAPGDAGASEQRHKAQVQAEAAAATRRARAQEARQKGDAEGAIRLYLEALAQWPGDEEAAVALREMERQRTRRGNVNGYRSPAAASARRPYPDDGKAAAAVAFVGRNELEHASLLASQGQVDAAIAMLQPLAMGRRPDPAVRGRLADLYFRKAEQLAEKDPAAAIDALKRTLQLAPGHPKATSKLKEMAAALPTPLRGTTRP